MKKHILVIPSFYHTDDDPLKGMFFKEQSEALHAKGLKIGVLYPERRSIKRIAFKSIIKYHFQVKHYSENGLSVTRQHLWNIVPTKLALGNYIWVKRCMELYEKYIRIHGRPDIIHAHCALWAGVAARKLSIKYSIPYIVTEHSTLFLRNIISNVEYREAKMTYERSSTVVAVSKPFAQTLTHQFELNNNDLIVIPNFIDTDFFCLKKTKDNNDFVFVTACFLNDKKRIDRLIEAFARLYDRNKNIRLIIIGEGDKKQELIKLTQVLKVESQVTFTGAANREEIRNYISSGDCFVLPSDIETFGVVLIEAMSVGLPLVATRSGGPEDIISDTVGYLCDKNVDSLANAMYKVYTEHDKFDPLTIRRYCIENFSNLSVTNRVIDLYEKNYKN